ncbi:IS1167, transposase [Streptococcus pneumoniae]|nr:IS1167, transposase [Streptococcus pneumoniae]
MGQLHFITKLLDIKDTNIQIIDVVNRDSHKEIIAKLDYDAPSCPDCGSLMKKYDFQKPSKIPYLETTGMPSRILLRKRRFKCYHCSKMMVAETPLVKKNHQIPRIINQKIAQKLIEKISMTDIAHQLAISTSTVIRKLNDFHFEHDFSRLPKIMSWDEYAFTKGKMSFIAQDFDNLNIITVLEGRTQAVIRNHFLRYDRAVRCQVKIITMDMFSPYYDLAKQLFPCAKIVLDRFHIIQHLSRAMSRFRVQIMNQFERKSHEYKAIKRYWKLIQQDSRKLSDKRFYRPTFRMHLTNKEILDKILSYSEDLKHHYQIYQLLLFHFQNKDPEKFFGLIEDNLKQVHPIFQTVFKTFLKNKEKIVNALQLHYSNAKLEATNNLIKLIKRNAFGFRLKKDGILKWHFVVWFLGATGARVSELIKLKVEHVEIGYFDIYSKGGKIRRLYIPKKLRNSCLSWLESENRRSGYLFLNKFNEPITARGVAQQLKNYADKYKMNPKVIYPHSFRHLFAKNFLAKYNDIALLADLMGHESIETTRIYLRKTATEQQNIVDKIVNW